jgi:hypothetical protein
MTKAQIPMTKEDGETAKYAKTAKKRPVTARSVATWQSQAGRGQERLPHLPAAGSQ